MFATTIGGGAPPVLRETERDHTVLKTCLLAGSILGFALSALTGSFFLTALSIVALVSFFVTDCTGSSSPAILAPAYNIIPPHFYREVIHPAIHHAGIQVPRGAYLGGRHPVGGEPLLPPVRGGLPAGGGGRHPVGRS